MSPASGVMADFRILFVTFADMKRVEPSARPSSGPLPVRSPRLAQVGRVCLGHLDVFRLHPVDGVSRFGDQDGLRRPIGEACWILASRVAVEWGFRPCEHLDGRQTPCCRQARQLVDLRHPVPELPIVATVPRLIETDLFVQPCFAELRQDGHTPTQERLAGFFVVNGPGWHDTSVPLRAFRPAPG